ncbi:MAG: DUF4190 domain-containing protein [Christensenella sp.]
MKCTKCQQEYDASLSACPFCGEVNEQPQAEQTPPEQPQPEQTPPEQPQPQFAAAPPVNVDNGAKGMAIGSLVCGILGLVFCWVTVLCIILGVVGVVLGVLAKKRLPEGQAGMATAGFVCGIIALVIGIIWTLMVLACAGFVVTGASMLDSLSNAIY